VLKDANLVRVRADAQRRIYALDPEGFDELEQWMTRIRRYWRGSLDALERVLKEEARKSEKAKSGKGKR
jgi:hypothetical protein